MPGAVLGAAVPWKASRHLPIALLAAVPLVATTLLPHAAEWPCLLGLTVMLGVPHGALDGEIGRTWLRPRFGRAWFPVFAVPYLLLAASVLAAWRLAPEFTLAAFLATSVWHFGSEDAGSGRVVDAVVLGGIPVAVPMLLHPGATTIVLATAAGLPPATGIGWLLAASLLWLAVALAWVAAAILRGRAARLLRPAGLVTLFALLPPLTAFAVYFVCIHAPAHVDAMIGDIVRAPRVRSRGDAAWRALPLTGLTLLIGAALWPAYTGAAPERMLALTIQGLAALTVPHMLLDACTRRAPSAGVRSS